MRSQNITDGKILISNLESATNGQFIQEDEVPTSSSRLRSAPKQHSVETKSVKLKFYDSGEPDEKKQSNDIGGHKGKTAVSSARSSKLGY